MPSLLRIYSNNQTNELITRSIEFVCKQLYILHRKPFLLQMFGSIAPILDKDDDGVFADAFKVSSIFSIFATFSRPFFPAKVLVQVQECTGRVHDTSSHAGRQWMLGPLREKGRKEEKRPNWRKKALLFFQCAAR